MNILFLHSSSDLYGASKIFLQTVKLMKHKGHQCFVVLSSEGPLADELRSLTIPVHIFSLGVIRRKYFNIKGVLDRIQKWQNASIKLSQLIQQEKIDLLYSNTAAVLIGGYVARKHKIKHIWHIHEIIEKPAMLHKVIVWCMRNWTDKIIVVSKAVREHWQKAGDHLALVYNGINAVDSINAGSLRPSLGISEEALVIGMAGRVHYWKGQDYFLDLAKELLKGKPELYFIMVGDAYPGYEYLEEKIKSSIEKSLLKGRVFFIGFCGDMPRFYNSIDLFILPSQQPDPLPTVVLEAMGAGKMVVATEQGGALEMVLQNETGIFIPLQDPALAAAKIIGHLQRDQLNEMGRKGKQRVEEYFSVAAFEQHLINVIESV